MLAAAVIASIERALAEDIGPGDATTNSIVPVEATILRPLPTERLHPAAEAVHVPAAPQKKEVSDGEEYPTVNFFPFWVNVPE